ncbi:YiiG family protein, partial [Escherichia coli]
LRIRDKVPYSYWDNEHLQDANSSWMVEDSFPRALREFNEMVDDYNRLR